MSLRSETEWHCGQVLVFRPGGGPVSGARTWILSAFVPVDEAGDQDDECEESDGAHQADEPTLAGYSCVDAGETCGERSPVTLTRLGLFIQTSD